MSRLHEILTGCGDLVMVGSSFGGLMATIYAMENGPSVRRMILLAPALNFDEFIPLARDVFRRLHFHAVDDDHLLGRTFVAIDWLGLLGE